VGAHLPQFVREPALALLDQFQAWAQGKVRLLTLAADVPGAEDLAGHAAGMGISVSLGHQMATAEDLARLARAGARALTHLGNGVPAVLPRHENPIWAGLANDDLTAMIIADGHHLPPAVLKVMIRAKGVERLIVVSDQASLAGMPPGPYRVAGNDVVLEPTGRLHIPSKGCLAGSSATMLMCMNHLASLGLLGLGDLEAVGFQNPLRLIGLAPGAVRAEPQVAYDAAGARFRLLAGAGH
jgi:N-acetylglucosamine-6-phosphate deacetylase